MLFMIVVTPLLCYTTKYFVKYAYFSEIFKKLSSEVLPVSLTVYMLFVAVLAQNAIYEFLIPVNKIYFANNQK